MSGPGGFITMHRMIDEWPLYQKLRGEQCHVITRLLFRANWKPSRAWWCGEEITVPRGTLLMTEVGLAKDAKVSRKVVRTILRKLERDGFISVKRGPVGGHEASLITIRNYDRFQSLSESGGQETGHERATTGPGRGPRPGHEGALSEPIEPENQEARAREALISEVEIGLSKATQFTGRHWNLPGSDRPRFAAEVKRLGVAATVEFLGPRILAYRAKNGSGKWPPLNYFTDALREYTPPRTMTFREARGINPETGLEYDA